MLRKIRITVATVVFACITLLFLDSSGALHTWLGWLAKIQAVPAVLALNLGVVIGLVLLTLIFGRVYCSAICPLGIFQDIVTWLGGKGPKKRYFRFTWSKANNWLRIIMLVIFVATLLAGVVSVAALIEPYGAYGRIAQNLFAPLHGWLNNFAAWIAERAGSYAVYSKEVWIRSIPTFAIAAVTFLLLIVLAWRGGRTWCNNICPVGTVLGFLSKFSLFRVEIDESKCVNCTLCGRHCKASCINWKEHKVDYSRCVACFDCVDTCEHGALKYRLRTDLHKKKSVGNPPSALQDSSRRDFLAVAGVMAGTAALKAQEKTDGGLAVILDRKAPKRKTPIVPPGAQSLRHLSQHCIGCQLCVAACPNGVLRPSTDLSRLMQPESGYERGFCRPECTECSAVCPAGAILPVTKEEKTGISIGHAVWIQENCLPVRGEANCGLCARRCPTGAIKMVRLHPEDGNSPRVPAVNTELCIGCGKCEAYCPSRPFAAIYVEGNEVHRSI